MRNFIFLLIVSFCVFLQIADTHPSKTVPNKIQTYSIEDLWDNQSTQAFIRDSLNCAPFREAMIKVKFGPLHPKIGGLTTEIVGDVYFIQMNGRYDLAEAQRIFFHELVHVYQFRRGWLVERPRDVIWMGQVFSWRIPWILRPWELQAELYTEQLFVSELDK